MRRSSTQEVLVGVVVLACLAGMVSLVALAVGVLAYFRRRKWL